MLFKTIKNYIKINKSKMEYYKEQETPNHKIIKIKHLNNFKHKSYKYSSTDNIFQKEKGESLHKIYNRFLISPYLIRKSRYQNALNTIDIDKVRFNNYYNSINNNIKKKEEIFEDRKEINQDKKNEFNEHLKYEDDKYINFPNIIKNQNENEIKNHNIRNLILNEGNRNMYHEEYKNNLINKNEVFEFPKINKKDNNKIQRSIEYNIIYKDNNNGMYYSNNNNKLSLSYDIKKSRNIKKFDKNQYISPIIAKIAKHNYLMRNPYSGKDEYLGPSNLKNNPILYPVDTYKFDFNRYINRYHINKFE